MRRLEAYIRKMSQTANRGRWGDYERGDTEFLFAYIRNWIFLPIWGPVYLFFKGTEALGRRLR